MKADLTRTEVIKLIAIANKHLMIKAVNLREINLSGLYLNKADLLGADLSGAYL